MMIKWIALAALMSSGTLVAQVYKVVDENGNVTYTDQPPPDGAAPMALPELTVVESDYADDGAAANADGMASNAGVGSADANAESGEKTPRELRQAFRDFRIISPTQDETYWGTANTVVVSWGASAAYEPGMSVSVVVDGAAQDASPSGNLSVTLDRGEHQVYAVLRDQRGRRIVTTDTVTFHVKQASARINPG